MSNEGNKSTIDDAANDLGNKAKSLSSRSARGISRRISADMKISFGIFGRILGNFSRIISSMLARALIFFGPVLAIFLIFLAVVWVAFDFIYETRGTTENYQMETMEEFNPWESVDYTEENSKEHWKNTGLSPGNKIVMAFYTYFSENSYKIMIEDNKKLFDPKDKPEVVDKYAREEVFKLSPNFLWTLDEFLNKNEFRFPEQFIKPVAYEESSFELKDVTDEKGQLLLESQAFDPVTKLPVNGKKVKGVWDYGFASVLHYKKYDEWSEGRGNLAKYQVFDKETEKKEWVIVPFEERHTEESKKERLHEAEVYMIDWATLFLGKVQNEIIFEEVNTSQTWTATEKRPYTYRKQNGVDKDGKPKYIEKTVQLEYVFEGNIWEKVPRYAGLPDMSNLKGTDYVKGYIENYESMIPLNVMTDFDFRNRTRMEEEELLKLFDSTAVTSGGGTGNISLGGNSGSSGVMGAMQHLPIVEKYAQMYGLDPYIVIAMMTAESGGDHYSTIPGGSRYNGAGVGAMQIDVYDGNYTKTYSAYNHQTGRMEKVTVNVLELEGNIQAGVMMLSNSVASYGYNIYAAITGYNFGSGGMDAVLGAAGDVHNMSREEVLSNNDLWLPFRQEVHQNPSMYSQYCAALGKWRGTYGTPDHLEKVLGYYASPDGSSPWAKDRSGNIISMDGSGIGTGSNSMFNSTGKMFGWLRSLWSSITDKWDEIFPKYKDFTPERVKYKNHITKEFEQESILKMILVMDESKLFSDYNEMTDEYWLDRIKFLFSSGLGQNPWSTEVSIFESMEEANRVFGGKVILPIDSSEIVVATPYGMVSDKNGKQFYHSGIDIAASVGTAVKSVSKGVVIEAGSSSSIGKYVKIKHSDETISIYGNLKEILVNKNQNVSQGFKIGTTGKNGENGLTGLHFAINNKGSQINPNFVFLTNGVSTGGAPPMSGDDSVNYSRLTSYAMEFLGVPYVWGGSARGGVDCSGFMFRVYTDIYGLKNKPGVWQRTSIRQMTQTALKNPGVYHVFNNWDELSPGDIIAIDWDGTRNIHNITHAAMFLGKEGGRYKVIHASSVNKVVEITTLPSSVFAYGFRLSSTERLR